jgi:hypothetical protein
MAKLPTAKEGRSLDPLVLGVSATLTILFVLWSTLLREIMEEVVNATFKRHLCQRRGPAAHRTAGDCPLFSDRHLFHTSANSAAVALAMFVTGKETPGRNMRAFWGIALGAVAAVLAATGSLTVIQTASIATAFPLMFLLLLVLYGTFKGLSEYRKAEAEVEIKVKFQV